MPTGLAAFVLCGVASTLCLAQTPITPAPPAPPPSPPLFATTKVADNVYVFRYGGHQSMFVVTPEGVIATDVRAVKES